MKNIRKLSFILAVTLILVGGLASSVTKVLAAAGEGTATIAVDGGAQGANVTVVQSTSHIFTTVLTVSVSGMTLSASSPTFTIPTGFTAPHATGGATPPTNAGEVNVDGEWFVVGVGGTCGVTMGSSGASGQVITVDVTTNCADSNTITLTYQGTSATAMGATALEVRTADGAPAAALIASSPTITVTAAPTPTPTPTSPPGSSSSSSSSSSSDGSSTVSTPLISGIIAPTIIESRRVGSDSIFISWGPYSGTDRFNVQYGLTNGNFIYNTNVTGFSTTINGLPANQPIWVQIAARNDQTIGKYGKAMLVGGPSLPATGLAPYKDSNPLIPIGIFAALLFLELLIKRKHGFWKPIAIVRFKKNTKLDARF